VASGVVLVGAGLAPTWAVLAGVLLLVGASDSVMDVAMNAHGLRVQRLYGRSIINGFHAWWSIGAALGGATGAVAAAARVPVAVHLLAAGVVIAVVVLTIVPLLLPGGDRAEAGQPQRRPEVRLVVRVLGLLAVVTLLAAAVEDVPYSWSAVYLQEAVGAPPGVAGLGLVAFTVAMTLGRLVADRLVTRLGDVAVTRGGAVVAVAGILGAVVVGTVPAAVVGFALAGLGAAPVYPALFHAAGNRPGVRAGDGIAFVSWVGRVGFLLAPLLVGVIADAAGIALGITVAAAAAACVALLAGALRPRAHRPAA
jgi:fucose permease